MDMRVREKAAVGLAISVAFSVLAAGIPVGFISGETAQAQDLLASASTPEKAPVAVPGAVSDEQEAEAFFSQLAEQNDNPVIQRMARESLKQTSDRGKAKATSSKRGGVREIEVQTITRNNASLAVPTLLNNKTMATFLVDTGASYTVITPRVAKKLGIVVTPETPRISIVTANGVVKAPIVTVDKIAIGQVEVEDIQVVIQPLGHDPLLAGLLGMNFFKNMDLTVRRNKLVLGIHE